MQFWSGDTDGNVFATDVAGNVESTKLFAFKADAQAPTVNIAQPLDDAVYRLGASKNASYKCTDKQSGLASCVGTVPSASSVDTSTVGTHAFTVAAPTSPGTSRRSPSITRRSTRSRASSARSATRPTCH